MGGEVYGCFCQIPVELSCEKDSLVDRAYDIYLRFTENFADRVKDPYAAAFHCLICEFLLGRS